MAYAVYSVVWVPPDIALIDPSCAYPHPFLIYEVSSEGAYALAISTKVETFFNERLDFLMGKTEDGFSTTGLSATSFAKNQDFFIANAHAKRLKVAGRLSGGLLERFKEFKRRML